MKINSKEIDTFLNNTQNHNGIFLIFGSNFGLVNEILEKLKSVFKFDNQDPFSNIKLNYDQIINDKRILLEEVETYAFFDKPKNILIDVKEGGNLNEIASLFEELTNYNLLNIRIIIVSDYLKTNDKFYNTINKFTTGYCIGCYDQDKNKIKKRLESYLIKNNLNYSKKEISNLLFEFSKDDQINNNIFENLDLLSFTKNVTFQKVIDTINENIDLDINELINKALLGDYWQAINILKKCKLSKTSSITICRRFLYKLNLLQKIYIMTNKGTPLDKILVDPGLNIFFKEREIIREQIKIWDFQSLQNIISKFLKTEIQCKKLNELEYIFLENTLLFIKIQIYKVLKKF